MVIGKTYTSLSVPELFEKYSEVQILTTVFPEITSIPCKISSPFRSDSNPSFSIYLDNNKHIKFKDFGDSDSHGGLLDLLCRKWKCPCSQVFSKIIEVMANKESSDVPIKPKQIKTFTRKELDTLTKVQVAVRPWKDYDYQYWASYGIEKAWLKHAEIYPISHKIITKKDEETGISNKYIFAADKYAYVFVERKEGNLQLKVYQPYNKKFKWCSKMDASVIGLWTKIPEYGDRVVICSSLKDALCLSCQLHIPTLCLQGEGYDISDTAISELKRRYKKVFISFDTDGPGIQDSKKLSERTGFINVIPDLGKEKDYSDYYKSLEDKEEFKQLEKLFV
jgi:hypothetical protein